MSQQTQETIVAQLLSSPEVRHEQGVFQVELHSSAVIFPGSAPSLVHEPSAERLSIMRDASGPAIGMSPRKSRPQRGASSRELAPMFPRFHYPQVAFRQREQIHQCSSLPRLNSRICRQRLSK